MICENGQLLHESQRFSDEQELIVADLDLDRILSDRMATSSYGDSIHDLRERARRIRRVEFDLGVPADAFALQRRVERFPYVPADPASRNERCEEVYNIQVRGLQTRLQATGIEQIVIGVSGGLDCTHALIVAARAMDRLGLPRANVLGYTLPGFATSARTLRNAHALMNALGVSASELDIRPSAKQMLRDLGHPAADGASPSTTSPTRTSRPASAPRTCSGWPTITGRWCSVPATCPSSRWAGRPTASATRCRTTTSTPRCPRR